MKRNDSLMQQPLRDENDIPDNLAVAEHSETTGEHGTQSHGDVVTTAATVAAVGIGAAIFEVALLPGMVLGVAAMALPRYYPKMGESLQPFFRSTIRGVNTANAALNIFDVASRAGRLGLRVARRR